MKVLLACDKFKGSLSAEEVNTAIIEGIKSEVEEVSFIQKGIADGGEGFVKALVDSTGGELKHSSVEDAMGKVVEAEWGIVPRAGGGKAAVIEMSAASGLWRMDPQRLDPMNASTYGTGQLILKAVEEEKVEQIYLGLGGSATNDGGAGMAQALGVVFSDREGVISERMCPSTLKRVVSVEVSQRIALPSITVACDVDNPLCGERGASAIFGPQKGADAELVSELDALLLSFSTLLGGEELVSVPGAGAAGGLGFGLLHFTPAELVSGFELVADAVNLAEAVQEADLVITGEGKLDRQSLGGKGPMGVALLAQKYGVPCIALAGGLDRSVDWFEYLKAAYCLADTGQPLEELISNGTPYLRAIAAEMARDHLKGAGA